MSHMKSWSAASPPLGLNSWMLTSPVRGLAEASQPRSISFSFRTWGPVRVISVTILCWALASVLSGLSSRSNLGDALWARLSGATCLRFDWKK